MNPQERFCPNDADAWLHRAGAAGICHRAAARFAARASRGDTGWLAEAAGSLDGPGDPGSDPPLVQATSEQAHALLAPPKINTASIERLNAPFRARLSALVRRGRALARPQTTLEAGMNWVGTVYNFCTEHKRLRQERPDGRRNWQERTPAMAAQIPNRCWTVAELLACRVAPPPLLLPRKPGRKPKRRACPA